LENREGGQARKILSITFKEGQLKEGEPLDGRGGLGSRTWRGRKTLWGRRVRKTRL